VYSEDGSVRDDLVGTLVSAAGIERLLFEAPAKDQQAWFINRYGADVNLGNIATHDALALEALRLGLRADTALKSW
jgi:phosphosulfolactate synthase